VSTPYVRKRDGETLAEWYPEKIRMAIQKAFIASEIPYEDQCLTLLISKVIEQLPDEKIIDIETIQDVVEQTLCVAGYWKVSRRYAVYRERRAALREGKDDLMDVIRDIDREATKDNANVGPTMAGKVLQISEAASGYFYGKRVIPREFSEAHDNGDIHIHDKAWYGKGLNCCQIPYEKLAAHGFNTGHGFIRPARSLKTAAMHASIIIQANQNEMYGGQSYPDFDNQFVATGIMEQQREKIRRDLRYGVELTGKNFNELDPEAIDTQVERILDHKGFQAMEALIYNLNTMHCLPYSQEIWIYDTVEEELLQIAIGKLAEIFEPNRYQTISLNHVTGKAEMKYITSVSKKDNNRRLITLIDNEGRKNTTTDNHVTMCMDDYGNVTGRFPETLNHVLSPRGIDLPPVRGDIGLDHYHSRKVQNYLDDHIVVTMEFAKIAGYYVAEGSVVGGSQLCFTVCSTNKEDELISLMQQCYGENITYNRYPTPIGKPKDIRFNVGKVWADMFKDKFGYDAYTKHIPVEILFAEDEVLISFLNGYFKCDGSIKENYIIATTVSKRLRNELNLMLLRLRELPHIAERTTSSNYGTSLNYEISISGIAENRLGLEFGCKVMYEQKHYDYEFLKSLIKENNKLIQYKKIKPHEIDIYAMTDKRLGAATNVFPVSINQCLESNSGDEYVYDLSVEDNETFLTAECIFVHNSRGGGQIPFSSINIGNVQSPDAAKICEWFLRAFKAGLGNGEQPIFPNVCFKIKSGVNMHKSDPYYHLFRLAQEVSAKRLNPSWVFCDSSFNKDGDISYMGCRTRVVADRHGESTTIERGNVGFTTENLPRLAIKAMLKHPDDTDARLSYFFELHNEVLNLIVRQLMHRFEYICTLKAKDFPFLIGQDLYRDADKLNPEDSIYLAARHGTLTLGFIGLAECLKVLVGKYHAESTNALALGHKIISYIRKIADEACEKYDLNFSVIATPAEGLSGRFTKLDREEFGTIPGATDKKYYTNSYHVPVDYPISYYDKIAIEGPFHKYCNGGHMSYIEFESMPQHNIDAIENIVLHMAACDMGYAAVNYPVDLCKSCGTHNNIIPHGEPCPVCGERDKIDRIRRITGYISTLERFNDAKVAEETDRIPHV